MADYSAIRAAIATRLATSATFIQVSSTAPDTISPPCAIVLPDSASYHEAMSNGLERFVFKILVLAQRFDDQANQTLLDGFVSGASSVRALIEGDLTLGGEAQTCQVTGMANYGLVDVNDTAFLGTEFTLEVFA